MVRSAIDVLKDEMTTMQRLQLECINEAGFVHNARKYQYQELTRKIKEHKEAIEYLEGLKLCR